ncbi:unnamed protein product, partial [Rotaria sordida]
MAWRNRLLRSYVALGGGLNTASLISPVA